MRIVLYGKSGCGKCEAAASKLERLGLTYSKRDYEVLTKDPVGWQIDGGRERAELIEAGVVWASQGGDFPIFVIDGVGMPYPEAMKFLKKRIKSPRSDSL